MPVPIKAVVAGVVTAGVGGLGIWLVHAGGAPECRTLDKDSGFDNGYKNKYAGNYGQFLAGTGTASSGVKPESNDAWWNWSFRNRYDKSKAKGGFKDLEMGAKASDKTNKSLQEKCEAAYKAEKTNVVTSDTALGDGTDKFLKDQVWHYCGLLSKEPKLLSEVESSEGQDKTDLTDTNKWSGKIGSTNKEHLLAIHHTDNTDVWSFLERKFKDEKSVTGFFGDKSRGATIKDRCNSAYKEATTGTDGNKPKEEDLYKWCSLTGKKSS